jgi:GNAT superfamily N-acetyltransferase
MMIKFKQANEFNRGVFYTLLCQSYADFLKAKPDYMEDLQGDWKKFDDDIYNYPDSIGKCVLISVLNNEPIGFFSWDPRKIPEVGEIGQNCIIPAYRGKGYGKLQIQKAVGIFQMNSTRIVRVTTASHPFFDAAIKMYLSCGFKEVGQSFTKEYGGLILIHYEYKCLEHKE